MKETFFEYLDIIQVFFQNIINNILNFDYVTFFIDYFENFWMEDFFKIIVVYWFLLWVAIIIWVTRDILARSNSILLQLFSILLVVFLTPIFGLIIYFIIRPAHKKYDEYDDEYEEVYEEVSEENPENLENFEKNINQKIKQEKEIVKTDIFLEKVTCYNCHYHIEEDFKFCPNCESQLLDNCKQCSKQIKSNWKICPYCALKITKEEKNIEEEEKEEELEEEKKEEKPWFFSNLFSWKEEQIKKVEEKPIKIKVEKEAPVISEKGKNYKKNVAKK